MAYSVKFKERVLSKISQGMSIAEASLKYNVSEQAIRNWRKGQNGFSGSKSNAFKRCSAKEKLEILSQVEMKAGSVREIAEKNGVNWNTLYRWIKDKNHILAVYLTQEQSPSAQWPGSCLAEGDKAMSLPTDSMSVNTENKALRDENQYLKAKIAYLEKLMELNGTPAPKFKKKSDTGQSEPSVRKESGP
jgi:transposase-like protein